MKHLSFLLVILIIFILFLPCQAKEKLTIAVTTLEGRGLAEGEAQTLTDALRNYLINTGSFRVMERGKMDIILKEQGFQASGACTDEACLVEMGQLLGVEFMITGSVGKVGGTYSVNIRMININTGEITRTTNKFYRGEIDGLLTKVIPLIAKEFAGTKKEPAVAKKQPAPKQKPVAKKEVKPAEKKGSNALVWIVVGGLVVGGGVVAYLLLTKDSGEEEEPQTGALVVTWPTTP
jgi:TolB-like protein